MEEVFPKESKSTVKKTAKKATKKSLKSQYKRRVAVRCYEILTPIRLSN